MKQTLKLNKLKTADIEKWAGAANEPGTYHLYIVACGYEDRACHWTRKHFDGLATQKNSEWLVLGIEDFNAVLSRKANEDFYESKGLKVSKYLIGQYAEVQKEIASTVGRIVAQAAQAKSRVEIHVDYSCMPRQWYCNFPVILEQCVRQEDAIYFWYSLGDYCKHAEYPTAGVSDFNLFGGTPSLGQRSRTHILGLGFDRIRSHSICSVVDPQNLFCFYAKPGQQNHSERIKHEHGDIFRQASYECELPIEDFCLSFSKLRSIAKDFRMRGDVIILPDGPKPLVLASALIPCSLSESGIVSFLISRGKPFGYIPVDVEAAGPIYGFQFSGQRL